MNGSDIDSTVSNLVDIYNILRKRFDTTEDVEDELLSPEENESSSKNINNIREFLKMLREKKKHIDLFNEHLQEIWSKFDDIKIKKYKLIQFKCNKIHDNLKENLSLMLKRNENLKLINSLSESLENNSAEFYKNVKSTFTQKWKILIYKYFNYIIIIIIIFLILI